MRRTHDSPAGAQKDYTKAQEGVRKDIERLLGVLNGRFRVLRRECELLDVEEVVIVSEVCAIMHNLLIHIGQSGDFDDYLSAEDDQFSLISNQPKLVPAHLPKQRRRPREQITHLEIA